MISDPIDAALSFFGSTDGEGWRALYFSFLGALSLFLVQIPIKRCKKRLDSSSLDMAGEWETKLFDEKGAVNRTDKVTIYHDNTGVYGLIERTYPPAERNREWKFTGYLVNNFFLGCYAPHINTQLSYGSWCLRLTEDHKFKGFYLKRTNDDSGKILPYPLEFERISPPPKRKDGVIRKMMMSLVKFCRTH